MKATGNVCRVLGKITQDKVKERKLCRVAGVFELLPPECKPDYRLYSWFDLSWRIINNVGNYK